MAKALFNMFGGFCGSTISISLRGSLGARAMILSSRPKQLVLVGRYIDPPAKAARCRHGTSRSTARHRRQLSIPSRRVSTPGGLMPAAGLYLDTRQQIRDRNASKRREQSPLLARFVRGGPPAPPHRLGGKSRVLRAILPRFYHATITCLPVSSYRRNH